MLDLNDFHRHLSFHYSTYLLQMLNSWKIEIVVLICLVASSYLVGLVFQFQCAYISFTLLQIEFFKRI